MGVEGVALSRSHSDLRAACLHYGCCSLGNRHRVAGLDFSGLALSSPVSSQGVPRNSTWSLLHLQCYIHPHLQL